MINGKIKISILLFCCCFFLSSCSKKYSSSFEEDYKKYIREVANAELYMPQLDELGNYKSFLAGRRTNNDMFIDTTETISLIVHYCEEDFDFVVSQLEYKYEFISSSLENYLDYEAEVNNYYFRVDSNSLCEMVSYPSGEIVFYPKCSLIIGINRIENKIAYLYYWDIEIQEMDDLDKFIEDKFVLE